MADIIKKGSARKDINEASAMSKSILIAPTKLNVIIARIRGKSYTKALEAFKDLPQKAGSVVWTTLHSAVANAATQCGLSKNELIISKAFANQGTMLKRVQPRAKGKAYEIQRKMSHVTICVSKIKSKN